MSAYRKLSQVSEPADFKSKEKDLSLLDRLYLSCKWHSRFLYWLLLTWEAVKNPTKIIFGIVSFVTFLYLMSVLLNPIILCLIVIGFFILLAISGIAYFVYDFSIKPLHQERQKVLKEKAQLERPGLADCLYPKNKD